MLHPSPVDTAFYSGDTAHKSASLSFFQKTANSPASIADTMFKSIGQATGTPRDPAAPAAHTFQHQLTRACVVRCLFVVVRDQGYFAVGLHMLLKVVDINFLSLVFSYTAHLSGEYKKLIAERKEKKN